MRYTCNQLFSCLLLLTKNLFISLLRHGHDRHCSEVGAGVHILHQHIYGEGSIGGGKGYPETRERNI